TRSRMLAPPMRIIALSPPPMRRASPPARTRPRVGGSVAGNVGGTSVVMHGRFAAMLRALLLDVGEVLIEHDAVFARERDKALAAGAPDQGEVGLARKLDAPGSESGARDQNRNAHADGLDHHFRGEAAGGVEDLVVAGNAVLEHPAGDLVDGVVATDVFHIDERAILLREHAPVDGAGLEIE